MANPKSYCYGFPIYGSGWVPKNPIFADEETHKPGDDDDASSKNKEESTADKNEDDDDNAESSKSKDEESTAEIKSQVYLVFAGGGGAGSSGIRNALVVASYDIDSNSLSDQPAARLEIDDDVPYRMAVHPGGEGVICALSKSCRWYEWEKDEGDNAHQLGLRSSQRVLEQLQDVGQQLALRFNEEGSVLAVGSEDGHLRVFKWPSMACFIDVDKDHTAVKDLDFSPDGKFLVCLGSGGPCRVWDVKSSAVVASLSKENDEIFGCCRFSQSTDTNVVLYTTVTRDRGASIVTWNTTSWKRMTSKQVVRDAISTFNVSADGKFLAIGTVQGDILVLNSANMQVQTVVRKAHLGIVTTLMISKDSRALVSASLDSSARLTLITRKENDGFNLWIILLILMVAIIAFALKNRGVIPGLKAATSTIKP